MLDISIQIREGPRPAANTGSSTGASRRQVHFKDAVASVFVFSGIQREIDEAAAPPFES